MRFEALDITIESRGPLLWIWLSGPFHREQVPNIREKIAGLIDDGNRHLVVCLENVTQIDDSVPSMFVELLNRARGKSGDLRLVFRNKTVADAFHGIRNVFSVYADEHAVANPGFLGRLRERWRTRSRRTGVRLSLPVALFLLFIVVGWFASLALVIGWQTARIGQQEQEIRELSVWREQTLIELQQLQERLRLTEQLGIVEGPQ